MMAKVLQMLRHVGKACLARQALPSPMQVGTRSLTALAACQQSSTQTKSVCQWQTEARKCVVLQACACSAYVVKTRCYSRKRSDKTEKSTGSASEQMYDAYEEFQAPSPFKVPEVERSYGYSPKVHTGGLLPRPKGDYEDKPLRGKEPVYPQNHHQWTKEKALFGQNDYIDILGDGSLHPWQLYQAPVWLKGFKGTELEQLIRRKRYKGKQMRHMYPVKYQALNKRIFYLWKKTNLKRSPSPFWGNRRRANTGRLDKIYGK